MEEEPEVTTRIDREELQVLLAHTVPSERHRITAPIPAATLCELLQAEPIPTDCISITFHDTPAKKRAPAHHVVIALSFAATLALGALVLVLV